MRLLPDRNRPQAIKCRARIAGIFCRKTRNAATAAIGCAAQHETAEGKASDLVAVMFSIVPGLGHIYKGHILAGLLWMLGAIPVGIFVFLAAVRLCRVGTRPVLLLSRRGDASCLRDPRSRGAAERGRRRGVLRSLQRPQS